MEKSNMLRGAALAALLAGPALAGGASGSTQVRVHCATNVSAKVVVHTVNADGTSTTRVFDRSGAASAAAPGAAKAAVATWLGVTTESSSEELRAQLSLDPGAGLTVFGVAPGGPAEKAGILEHDVLLRFNDQSLMDPDQLKNLVRAKKSGEQAKLTYLRKGRQETAAVTLSEREDAAQDEAQVIQLGNLSIDVESLMRQLPNLGSATSGGAVCFATNWSFGGASGGAWGSGGSSGSFSSSGGGALNPEEVMRNLKVQDAAVRQAVEEALKAAGQAQRGTQK